MSPRPEWTPTEAWAWSQLCQGKPIDFNARYGSSPDPTATEGWTLERQLSARFLKTILLEEPFKSAVAAEEFTIIGGWLAEDLSLSHARIRGSLFLRGSRFDGHLLLAGSQVEDMVSLDGSHFAGPLFLPSLEVGMGFHINRSTFSQAIMLHGSRIGWGFSMTESTVGKVLPSADEQKAIQEISSMLISSMPQEALKEADTAKAEPKPKVEPAPSSQQQAGVSLDGASIIGEVRFQKVKVAGLVSLRGSRIEGGLRISRACRFLEGVSADDARITGAVTIEESSFGDDTDGSASVSSEPVAVEKTERTTEALSFNAGEITGDVSLNHVTAYGIVILGGPTIGGNLFVRGGSRFVGEVWLSSLEVHGNMALSESTFERGVMFSDVTVGGDLSVRGSTFEAAAAAPPKDADVPAGVDSDESRASRNSTAPAPPAEPRVALFLRSVKIGGGATIVGGTFHREVVFTGSIIGGSLSVREGSRFVGEVGLSSVEVRGDITLSASTFEREVMLASAAIRQNIHLSESTFERGVTLSDVTVGGYLLVRGSTFEAAAAAPPKDADVPAGVDNDESRAGGPPASDPTPPAEPRVALFLRSVKIGGGATIVGGTFHHPVFFASSTMGDLSLRSRFEGEVELSHVAIAGDVQVFGGSEVQFHSGLSLENSEVGGNFKLHHGVRLESLEFRRTKLRGNVEIAGSKITENLKMESVVVEGTVEVGYGSELSGIAITDGKIGNFFAGKSLTLADALNVTFTTINGFFGIGEAFKAKGVEIFSTHIAGSFFALDSLTLADVLKVGITTVNGFFGIGWDFKAKKVEIVSTHVMGETIVNGVRLTGELIMNLCEFGGSLRLSDIELPADKGFVVGYSKVARGVFLGDGLPRVVALVGSDLGAQLSLEKQPEPPPKPGTVAGKQIRGIELNLFRTDEKSRPKWPEEAHLSLRNARVEAVQGRFEDWPPSLDLDGFVYQRLGGPGIAGKSDISRWSVDQFTQWLGRHGRFYFPRNERSDSPQPPQDEQSYSPQPYEQLAKVLRESGKPTISDDILFAGRERERGAATGLHYFGLTALRWVIGYGYRIWIVLIWVIFFVSAGAVALRVSGEGRRHDMPCGISYSLDMLLPIIELRKRHNEIDLGGWVRYYFYAHKIVGWILASFLVVGLAGLTK